MASNLGAFLRHIRELLEPRPGADVGDGALLERFTRQQDEAAFAALVERHGPMVRGVCRRILGDDHDADDAFQVAFLVLASKASSIRRQQSIGPWLYQVAYHVAVKARAARSRQREQERQTMFNPRPDLPDDDGWRELGPALDEELGRLPAKYRAPLVLCYLEGKTNEQAARELGWPAGSMSRRLARGRELLRNRLAKRGVTAGAVGLGALAAGPATAAVPSALVGATVRAAVLINAGSGIAGSVSAPLAAQVREALWGMSVGRLKAAAAVVFTVALLVPLAAFGVQRLRSQANPQTDGDTESPRIAARLVHGGAVYTVAFSPDGQLLATGGRFHDILLWDTAGALVRRLQGHNRSVNCLAFAPDGKTLATGGGNGDSAIRVWDVVTGEELARLEGHPNGIFAVAFSSDGKRLASAGGAGDCTVRLWDVALRKEVARWKEGEDRVAALAFSPDGSLLAAGTWDWRLRLREVATGRRRPQFGGDKGDVRGLAFAPDGHTLVAGGANAEFALRFREVASGKERGPRVDFKDWTSAVAFTPDGKFLASGGEDGVVHLWDTDTGKEHLRLAGHAREIHAVTFSPDGRLLVSGGQDGAALVWDLSGQLDRQPAPPIELSRPELDAAWADLASTDALRAFAAVQKLSAAPSQAVPFLRDRVKPAARPDEKQIRRTIEDLNSKDSTTRKRAFAELEQLGELAAPALRNTLKGDLAKGPRQQVEELLTRIDNRVLTSENLRNWRALKILERIATPDARQLLETLAGGTPEAWFSQQAKAALGRLRREGRH